MNVVSILPAHTVSTKAMSFKANVFSAEISDFGPEFAFRVDLFGAPSFFIQSENTGDIKEFKFVVDERNAENEILFWVFRCTAKGFRHLTAKVFND